MKLLVCKFCSGEVDIIEQDHSINKKIKCRDCGLSNVNQDKKEPEIFVKKRTTYSS